MTLTSAALPPARSLTSAVSSIDVGPATRARRGHDKDRGADPGDRRLGRGLGDLREEPPARVGGLRYKLRVSRPAHGGGRVWVAAETTAQQTVLCLAHFQRREGMR